MHNAPAVRYLVALSRHAVAVCLVVWLMAAALCGWLWFLGAGPGEKVISAVTLLAGGCVAALSLRSMPRGVLRWDGLAWWWMATDAEVQVTVALRYDLQRVMVLHVAGIGRAETCCVVEASTASQHAWGDLRRAVLASARSASFTSACTSGSVTAP